MDAVSLSTRKAYMLACHVAAGVAVKDKNGKPDINWDKRNPPEVNRTIDEHVEQGLPTSG